MKLHIVVPTIMTNPRQEFKCLDELVSQFEYNNLDFQIYFVANVPDPEFDSYIPTSSKVQKSISNLEFSISRALNSVFKTIEYGKNDILAFIQSDTFFKRANWITSLLEVVQSPELKAGVVGLRPHVDSNQIGDPINFKQKFDIHPVLWSDGVMLFTGEVFDTVGEFDENYFGDCESQDFCHSVYQAGYTNYWCSDKDGWFGYSNRSTGFEAKARSNREVFLQKVQQSRRYFKEKWR